MPESQATSGSESAPYNGSSSTTPTHHTPLDNYHNIASTLFNHQDGEELEAEFLLAARNGDINTVERILQRRNEDLLNVDVRDQETGNTAIIWAAKRGYVKIVALLLKHGADVTLRNYEGQTALEVASQQIQRQLLDGVDNGGPHRNLLQAAWQGNAALVQNILSETRRLDINCRNADGLTPLLLVARDLQLFEKLGSKVNQRYDPHQVVAQLLACRADPNAMDDEGRTALHYASSCKNPLAEGIIQLLLQQGSDVELRDRRCFTPIHWASQSGSVDVVNTLLGGGSDANARGYAGTTPLHISAINGHDQVASSLLDHGADVTLVDDSGLTAVDVAKTKKVKATLKQAWVSATQGRAERNLRPVRVASGEGTRKSGDGVMSTLVPPNKRVCGQVLIDLEVSDTQEKSDDASGMGPVDLEPGPAPEVTCRSQPLASGSPEPGNVTLSQVKLSFSSSSFDTLTPRKAAMSVLQRQLTNAEKARKAEEQMIRSISRMSGMSPTPRSTVAQRLAPLKSHTPRNRKEIKFGPGTKMHDGSRTTSIVNSQTGARKCQSEPSRVVASSNKECHIPVTILGLDLDENLQDVNRLKRLNQGPIGQYLSKKGHNRNLSDPSCPSPVPQLLLTEDPTIEDFYLKGRSKSHASRTSHEYDLTAISSLSVSPPRGTVLMRLPSASDSRLRRRLPDMMEEERCGSSRARTPTIEEEQRSALRSRTPVTEDEQRTQRARTPDIEQMRLLNHSRTPVMGESANGSSHRANPPMPILVQPADDEYSMDYATIDYSSSSSKDSSPRSSYDSDCEQPPMVPPGGDIHQIRNKTVLRQGHFNIEATRVCRSNDSGLPEERNSVNCSLNSSCGSSGSGTPEGTDSGETKSAKPKVRQKPLNKVQPSFSPTKSPGAGPSCRNTSRVPSGVSNNQQITGIILPPGDSSGQQPDDVIDDTGQKTGKGLPMYSSYRIHSARRSQQGVDLAASQSFDAGLTQMSPRPAPDSPIETVTGQQMRLVSANDSHNPKTVSTSSPNSGVCEGSTGTEMRTSCQPSASQSNDKKSVINDSRPTVPPRKNKQKTSVNNNVVKPDVQRTVSSDSGVSVSNTSSKTTDSTSSPVNKPQTTTYVVKLGQSDSNRSPLKENNKKLNSPVHSSSNKPEKPEKPAVPARPAGLRKGKISTPNSSPKKSVSDAPVIVTHPPVSDASDIAQPTASSQKTLLLNPFNTSTSPVLLKTDSLDSSQSEPLAVSPDSASPPTHIDRAVTITISSSPQPPAALDDCLESKQPKMPCLVKDEHSNKGQCAKSMAGSGSPRSPKSPRSPHSPVSPRSQTNQAHKDTPTTKSSCAMKNSAVKKPTTKVTPASAVTKKPSEHHGPVISDPFEAIRVQNIEQTPGGDNQEKASRPKTSRDKPVPPPRRSTSKQMDVKKSRAKSSHLEVTPDAIGINHVTKKKGSGKGKKVRRCDKSLARGKSDDKMAFVGGIGWQIRTDCNEDNTVRPARFASLADSSSEDEEFSPVIPNYVYDLDDSKKTSTKRMRLTKIQLPGVVASGDTDSSDEEVFEGAEDVQEDEVIFMDRSASHSPLDTQYTPRFPDISQTKAAKDETETIKLSQNKKSSNRLDTVWANAMVARARSPSPVMHAAPETAETITTFVKSVESSQKSDPTPKNNTKAKDRVPPPTASKPPVKKNKPTKQGSVSGKSVQKVTATGNCGKPISERKPADGKKPVAKASPVDSDVKGPNSQKTPPTESTSAVVKSDTPSTGSKKSAGGVTTQNVQKSPGALTLPSAQKSPASHTVTTGQKAAGPVSSSSSPKVMPHKSAPAQPASVPDKSKSSQTDLSTQKTASSPAKKPDRAAVTAAASSSTTPSVKRDSSENASQISNEVSKPLPETAAPQPSSREPSVAKVSSSSSSRRSKEGLKTSKEQSVQSSPQRSHKSPHHSPKKSPSTEGSPRKSQDSQNVVRSFSRKRADRSESKEEAELSAVIDEILKTTPHPSLSLRSQIGEDGQKKDEPFTDDAEDQMNKDSMAFSEVPVTNAVSNGSGRRTIEEEEQLQRLLSNFKHMPLTVSHPPDGVSDWMDSVSPGRKPPTSSRSNQGKPPAHPKTSSVVTASMESTKATEESTTSIYSRAEKSPRFIRKVDSWKEGQVKLPLDLGDSDDDDAMSDCSLPVGDMLSDAHSLASTIGDGDGIVVPPDGRIVTSRIGRRCNSRAASAMTNDSTCYDNVETIQWKRGNMLGKGAYGVVWCGLTNAGELIAVKEIELNTDDMEKAELEYEKIQEEVELLKTLRHNNIVGYLGTSLEDSTVCIFMQFVPGGSIANYLARFGSLEEEVFCYYTKQILEGVEYLHMNNIIHRDIKGGNIMVMHNGVIKLIDFGCAKRLCLSVGALDSCHKRLLKSMRGTPYWMAPEVVKETGYGTKSDIWSIGCTVFEMASRKPPWADMTPMAAIFAIGSDKPVPQLPDKYSSDAKDFVNQCLTRDQSQRPSARELLSHTFILRKKKR